MTTDSSNATQCVYGSLDEYVSLPDVSEFLLSFNLPSEPVSVQSGHDLTTPCYGNRSCIEANADVQYISAMAPHAKTTYWYVDTYKEGSKALQFLIELLELTEPPMVSSISYGVVEQVNILHMIIQLIYFHAYN